MKTIQITIDEQLLAALDRALKGQTRRRSAFIRQPIARALRQAGRKRLEDLDREGYGRYTARAEEFGMDAEGLSWGDPWEPRRRNRTPK